MFKKWLIYILVIVIATPEAGSQEVITGLLYNQQLINSPAKTLLKSTKGADTLILPFIDDFSGGDLFPLFRQVDRQACLRQQHIFREAAFAGSGYL